jgi:hypothetical protein
MTLPHHNNTSTTIDYSLLSNELDTMLLVSATTSYTPQLMLELDYYDIELLNYNSSHTTTTATTTSTISSLSGNPTQISPSSSMQPMCDKDATTKKQSKASQSIVHYQFIVLKEDDIKSWKKDTNNASSGISKKRRKETNQEHSNNKDIQQDKRMSLTAVKNSFKKQSHVYDSFVTKFTFT